MSMQLQPQPLNLPLMMYRGNILRVLEVNGVFILTVQMADNLSMHHQNP